MNCLDSKLSWNEVFFLTYMTALLDAMEMPRHAKA